MKKGIVFSAVASMLLVGTLYAYNSSDCNDMREYHKKEYSEYATKYRKSDCKYSKSKSYTKYHKKDKMYKRKDDRYFKHSKFDMSKMFRGLNLSIDQRFQISILVDEMKLELKKLRKPSAESRGLSRYISENGFDKNAYLQDKKAKYEKVLEIRANSMEKMFKVLTPQQLKMFKDRVKGYKHIHN